MNEDLDPIQRELPIVDQVSATQYTNTEDLLESSVLKFLRIIAGYVAIIFILPYLAIKISWIFGVPVGMLNTSMVDNPTMRALNIITFCMDVWAILLALTFSHRWGGRMPVWLVLFPIWVASGFLSPIIMAAPITVLVGMLNVSSGQPSPPGQWILQSWVRGIVFTSFTGQGLALLTAFILYALRRWKSILMTRIIKIQPFHSTIVWLGNIACVIAIAIGSIHFLWVVGLSLGLPEQALLNRGTNFLVFHLAIGISSMIAAIGVLVLVNRFGFNGLWVSLSASWIGAGTMFSWGAWLVLGDVLRISSTNTISILTVINIIMGFDGLFIAMLICAVLISITRRYSVES